MHQPLGHFASLELLPDVFGKTMGNLTPYRCGLQRIQIQNSATTEVCRKQARTWVACFLLLFLATGC